MPLRDLSRQLPDATPRAPLQLVCSQSLALPLLCNPCCFSVGLQAGPCLSTLHIVKRSCPCLETQKRGKAP